jgi:predicted lysophospholipase L1 biosynthesis ABC-type transport system permease subunit
VVVLSELAASAMSPTQDPIGQHLAVQTSGGEIWAEVIGVVRQTDVGALNARYPLAFLSIDQDDANRVSIFASGGPSAASLAPLLAGALRTVDPDVAITNVGTADARIAVFLAPVRLAAAVLAVLSSVGVAIAIVGLYATVAFFVAARTREIGVRVALGATARDVRRLVVRQGVRPVVAGGIFGLVGSYGVAGLLTNLLYGIAPRDPLTFIGVPLGLLLVGTVACLGPARSASHVDPNVALRHS